MAQVAPPDTGTPERTSAPVDPARARTILIVLASAALLVNFVETMLVPALPTLASFFDGTAYTTIAWVVSIYLLVGVATTPLFAKLGDIYGKRRVLMAVLSIYVIGVVLAPLTPMLAASLGVSRASAIFFLIGVRGLQGAGLAMFPLAFAMIGEELPPAQVAPAQGLIGAMFAGGAAMGLLGGSWLIQSFGWQWAYGAVMVPSILVALGSTRLPESRILLKARLDAPGAALLGGAMGALLLGLTLGPSWGWANLTGGSLGPLPFGVPELFVLGVLFVLGFYVREKTAQDPIIDLARFSERNVALALFSAFLVGLTLYVGFVALTLWTELPVVGLGRSILDFGILSLPTTATMMVTAPLVGKAVVRVGPRPVMMAGGAVSAAGFLLLLAFHGSYLNVMLEAIPTFGGLIGVFVSTANLMILASPKGETGIHTGLLEMVQDMGAATAPVVVTTVLASLTASYAVQVGTPQGAIVTHVLLPSGQAFDWLFAIGAILAVGVVIVAAFVRNYRFATESADPSGSAAAAPVAGGAPTE